MADETSPETVRAADDRGRMWAEGEPLTPAQAERARIAEADRRTADSIARERAGWERDPATGQWRKGSWA